MRVTTFERYVKMFLVQATLCPKLLFRIIREAGNRTDLLQQRMSICCAFARIAQCALSMGCLFLKNRKKNIVIQMKTDYIAFWGCVNEV